MMESLQTLLGTIDGTAEDSATAAARTEQSPTDDWPAEATDTQREVVAELSERVETLSGPDRESRSP